MRSALCCDSYRAQCVGTSACYRLPVGETTAPPRAELNSQDAGCKADIFRDLHVKHIELLVSLVELLAEAVRKRARGIQKGVKYMASGCAGGTDPSRGGLAIGVPSIKRV